MTQNFTTSPLRGYEIPFFFYHHCSSSFSSFSFALSSFFVPFLGFGLDTFTLLAKDKRSVAWRRSIMTHISLLISMNITYPDVTSGYLVITFSRETPNLFYYTRNERNKVKIKANESCAIESNFNRCPIRSTYCSSHLNSRYINEKSLRASVM